MCKRLLVFYGLPRCFGGGDAGRTPGVSRLLGLLITRLGTDQFAGTSENPTNRDKISKGLTGLRPSPTTHVYDLYCAART
jgi:hypothetical protein